MLRSLELSVCRKFYWICFLISICPSCWTFALPWVGIENSVGCTIEQYICTWVNSFLIRSFGSWWFIIVLCNVDDDFFFEFQKMFWLCRYIARGNVCQRETQTCTLLTPVSKLIILFALRTLPISMFWKVDIVGC